MALKPQPNSFVFISTSDGLDHDTLNKAFQRLIKVDKQISESFINSIGIWHSRWYYNSSIIGYAEGDMVWLNTEDPLRFVKTHHKIIKEFTDLRAEVLVKLPEWDESDDSVIEKYLNAMSGYVESNSSNAVPLEPIFDIGNYEKPIQLAVSVKNNNKASVNDRSAWKKLFVDAEEDEAEIISTIIELKDKILQRHLLNYHLSGEEEYVEAKLSDYLDIPSDQMLYDNVPSEWYANYNSNSNNPQYGLDYVTEYIRKPFLISGSVSQYQAVRYWKSGWMEHFGTISTKNPMFVLSDGIYIKIPFNWNIIGDDSDARAYESGELAKTRLNVLSALETDTNLIPPKDNFINVIYEQKSVTVHGKVNAIPFKNSDYNLIVSPIYQDENGITDAYIYPSYVEEPLKQNWNTNFLTNEIIESMKTKNDFCLRADSRTIAPYISYYATGIGDF